MELYMNSPEGYPFAEKIAKTDIGRLKSFLIGISPDEALQQIVRDATNDEVISMLEKSGFTFDETWYGVRLLEWQK